jgi:hypothetical protein
MTTATTAAATKWVPPSSATSATHAPKATPAGSALSVVPDRPAMQTTLVASAEVAMHAEVALSVTATKSAVPMTSVVPAWPAV